MRNRFASLAAREKRPEVKLEIDNWAKCTSASRPESKECFEYKKRGSDPAPHSDPPRWEDVAGQVTRLLTFDPPSPSTPEH